MNRLLVVSMVTVLSFVAAMKAALFLTGTRSHQITSRFGTVTKAFQDLLRLDHITAIPIHLQPEKDFPTIDFINEFDLLIIPGAAKSVEWELPWMLHLESLIRDERRKPWVFGVCFGHQLACKAFGGTVEIHEGGWEVGVTSVFIEDAEFAKLVETNTISVLQSHKRQVTQVPERFTVWASNEHTPIQGVLSTQHKIFTSQFHPDFTAEYFVATRKARPVTDKEIEKVRNTPLQHHTIKQIIDYIVK